MDILGISGKKQSGKDTVCNILKEHLKGKREVIRIAFADALKVEVAEGCGVSLDYLEEHKENFRLILQGWGTDFRRKLMSDTYWIHRWLDKVNKVTNNRALIVAPDIRFHNEFECIKELGGQVWYINRGECSSIDRHQSEIECSNFICDMQIANRQLIQLTADVLTTYEQTIAKKK